MDIKELTKLIKLLRSQGVTDYSDGTTTLKLTESHYVVERQPRKAKRKKSADETISESIDSDLEEGVNWDDLTPEQQMAYSVGGAQ